MRNNQLAKCPFCGGKAQLKCYSGEVTQIPKVLIKCKQCHIVVGPINYDWPYIVFNGELDKNFTIDEAIEELTKMWNTRITA